MTARFPFQAFSSLLFFFSITLLFLATPAQAFGAGFVSGGATNKGTNFRHGDIALAIPLLATANRRISKQIYFGNWLRDFSQLLDRGSLAIVPEPILRALVAVFAFVQFGYATREFEVTSERLGFYRPEEHVDNPKGYDGGAHGSLTTGLRARVDPREITIDRTTGMKNYIANTAEVADINPTSAEYVERQLIAAIACGRDGNQEAYIHLGAALHTLEDFMAHSNWVELCYQLIARGMSEQGNVSPALGKVFAFVGDSASIQTTRGAAPPLVTGTFGALDLYQTLLGEIDDKLSAMSLPGLQTRTQEGGGMLQNVAKTLIAKLSGLNPRFENQILSIQNSASISKPADWGELQEKPTLLWDALEPVFKLRDDIVKWVYDNLTVRAVQDAIAAISTAVDKLVYLAIGMFLGPVLAEFSKVLKQQEQHLLIQDQEARLATGERSIFNPESNATDPTHSQLCKDHYDSELNEIAGLVAARISSYTISQIIPLWQPGNTLDPCPALSRILQTFHHPFNAATDPPSEVQTLMYAEASAYVNARLIASAVSFEASLAKLNKLSIADQVGEFAAPHGHSHVDALTAAHAPTSIAPQTAHDLTTTARTDVQRGFVERIESNISRQIEAGMIPGLKLDDVPFIKSLLFSPPSGESPNPLDEGLAKLGGVGLLGAFDGIEIHEIASAQGMGNMLKDAVVSLRLMDVEGLEKAEVSASTRFGWRKSDPEEKRKMREMRRLLEFRQTRNAEDGGQFEERRSATEKVREGFGRLKMKVSNGTS